MENTPMPELPAWCRQFSSASRRVLFLVDCQSAANLANGLAELADDFYDPPFRRSSRYLQDFWRKGWLPCKDHDNYVCWVPRRHNKTADYLANIALHDQQDFEWTEDCDVSSTNLIVMSDGGFRKGDGSAAWAIFAMRPCHLEIVHFT